MGEPGALGAGGPWGGHQQHLPRGPDRKRVGSPRPAGGVACGRGGGQQGAGSACLSSPQQQAGAVEGGPPTVILTTADSPRAGPPWSPLSERWEQPISERGGRPPPLLPHSQRRSPQKSGRLSLKEGARPGKESLEQSSLRSRRWGSLSALGPSATGTWDSNTCNTSHRSYRPGAGGGYRHKAEISDKSPVMKRKLTRMDPNKIADQDKYFPVLFKRYGSKTMHEPRMVNPGLQR